LPEISTFLILWDLFFVNLFISQYFNNFKVWQCYIISIYGKNSKNKDSHGTGKVTWYLNGKFIQSDEGNLSYGKRHGKITQRFADGRVVVSEWVNGEKVK